MLTETKLRSVIDCALETIGRGADTVELSFVTDAAMRRLNREHRGKDKPTDVLSFPMFEAKWGKLKIPRWERSPVSLGAIVIAKGVAKRQALAFEHSLFDEVTRLIVHSVVHLVGYDHELSVAEEKKMFAVEDRILDAWRARLPGR